MEELNESNVEKFLDLTYEKALQGIPAHLFNYPLLESKNMRT